ncbi:MAG: iron-containing alcohol dehydrogenase [Desulfobacterales bacterium]|nr:iron-containing alcohol dehydrogenase [Desulfobacterales bacterium]
MNINRTFEFVCPTKIIFEVGGAERLGLKLTALGWKNVFLVADKGVVASGVVEKITSGFDETGISCVIFSDFETNPTITSIIAGSKVFKENKSDVLVGVGGGSSMDAAKALAILATNSGPLQDYEGPNKIPNPVPPIIAIPTTAGTGAEVNGSSVLTDDERKYKLSIRSTYLYPTIALLDPSLLRSLPPKVIAATGMDALIHALESYISLGASPITEQLALASIGSIADNIRLFYANPDNLEAAGNMLLASTMAAMSFGNARLGCIHALAHSLGGLYNLPHGVTCTVLLPHAMEHNLISDPDKFSKIASVMGENIVGLSRIDAAKHSISAVKKLISDLELPTQFRELSVREEDVPQIVENAIKTGIHLTSPRNISSEGLESIIRASL